jgi:hypothetical protein
MFQKVITGVAAAMLVSTLFGWTEAVARAGGGSHSGGTSAAHTRGYFRLQPQGAHRGEVDSRGTGGHNFGPNGNTRRNTGWHGEPSHPSNRHNWANHETHWHTSSGFGDDRHKSSHFQGEWHTSQGFGDGRQPSSSGSQGEWHKTSSGFQRSWEVNGASQ